MSTLARLLKSMFAQHLLTLFWLIHKLIRFFYELTKWQDIVFFVVGMVKINGLSCFPCPDSSWAPVTRSSASRPYKRLPDHQGSRLGCFWQATECVRIDPGAQASQT